MMPACMCNFKGNAFIVFPYIITEYLTNTLVRTHARLSIVHHDDTKSKHSF